MLFVIHIFYYNLYFELYLPYYYKNTMPTPRSLYSTIHKTNSPTESDLG